MVTQFVVTREHDRTEARLAVFTDTHAARLHVRYNGHLVRSYDLANDFDQVATPEAVEAYLARHVCGAMTFVEYLDYSCRCGVLPTELCHA